MKPKLTPITNIKRSKLVFGRNEKGQAFVEMAVAMIILLILLAGIVDISRTILVKMSMQDAAEEGVIYGSAFPQNCTQIKYRVLNNLYKLNGMTLDKITVTYDGVACPSSGTLTGKLMKVSITYNFPISMPFLGTSIGSTRNITVESKGIVLRSP